jgi:hypothetical protein
MGSLLFYFSDPNTILSSLFFSGALQTNRHISETCLSPQQPPSQRFPRLAMLSCAIFTCQIVPFQ